MNLVCISSTGEQKILKSQTACLLSRSLRFLPRIRDSSKNNEKKSRHSTPSKIHYNKVLMTVKDTPLYGYVVLVTNCKFRYIMDVLYTTVPVFSQH